MPIKVASRSDKLLLDLTAGDVASPSNGTVWYNNTTGKFRAQEGGAVKDLIGAGGGSPDPLDLTVQTVTAPSADTVRVFAGKSGGRVMPRFIGPNGQDATFQPHIGKNKVSKWNAAGNGTVIVADGSPALTVAGTATTRNVSTTNRATRIRMIEWLVTTAATTAIASFRAGAAQWSIGDASQSDMGGFHYVCTWGTATGGATATNRAFVGMANTTAAPTDVEPSTITNIVGMGWDAADANISIMHRGTGAVTKIDLGAAFAVPTTDRANAYLLELYSPPGTTQKVGYKVTNIITNAVAEGEITANLPTAATFLAPRGWMSVGGTSSVIGIALSQLYIETDW